MAAQLGDAIVAYVITGEEDEVVPDDATHVSVHESVTVIRARLFLEHPNIVELICHDGVERIEEWAFYNCPRLKRVIMLGVKVVERGAFAASGLTYIECSKLEIIEREAFSCVSLTSINFPSAKVVEQCAFHSCGAVCVECPKLERIGVNAFTDCSNLSSIYLPSAKFVGLGAFVNCRAMKEAKFGSELESISDAAFKGCYSLERLLIPLKEGVIVYGAIRSIFCEPFEGCDKLKRVDIVEEAILRETIAALQFEEWRNDLNGEIDSINQILPELSPVIELERDDITITLRAPLNGGKAPAIREWIRRVLRKISDYETQHRHFLSEAAVALQLALPKDIAMNHVVPFLNLPLHTYGRGE